MSHSDKEWYLQNIFLDEPYFKNPENYADRKHRKLKQTSANPQLSVLTKNKIK